MENPKIIQKEVEMIAFYPRKGTPKTKLSKTQMKIKKSNIEDEKT